MKKCAVCHEPVKSGVVVHSERLEQLRKAQPLDNKPMTVEEMQAVMDSGANGLHIWLKDIKVDAVFLAIIDRVNGRIVGIIGAHPICFYREADYGKKWIAYRYNPREWISVKDKLPEPYVDVLVRRSIGMSVEYIGSGGVWRDGHVYHDKHPVTHWMPLPEPPEVE